MATAGTPIASIALGQALEQGHEVKAKVEARPRERREDRRRRCDVPGEKKDKRGYAVHEPLVDQDQPESKAPA